MCFQHSFTLPGESEYLTYECQISSFIGYRKCFFFSKISSNSVRLVITSPKIWLVFDQISVNKVTKLNFLDMQNCHLSPLPYINIRIHRYCKMLISNKVYNHSNFPPNCSKVIAKIPMDKYIYIYILILLHNLFELCNLCR